MRESVRHFGYVTTQPVEPGEGVGSDELFIWRPGPGIDPRGGDDLSFALRSRVDPGGIRGFCTTEDAHGFVIRASVGGLMILAARRGMSPAERGHHHALRLIYQHGSLAAERHARRFRNASDLLVVGDDAPGLGGADVLPERLGLGRDGRGKRWKIGELMSRGRAAIAAAGRPPADEEQVVAAGLYEAARIDPFTAGEITRAQARAVVARALFDSPPPEVPTGDEEHRAVDRLFGRVAQHVDDDGDAFRLWFYDGRDDLIRQVAKQKKGGGPIDRAVVRRAFLIMIRSALASVAACVTAQMRAFLDALPLDLRDDDRSRFGAMYLGRDDLGGIPLLMLHDRFHILRPAALGLMGSPGDPAGAGALLRMLDYYGEMAATRRAADRAYKRRAGHREAGGGVATHQPLEEAPLSGELDPGSAAELDEVGGHLARRYGASCQCRPSGSWTARLPGDMSADPAEVELVCGDCGDIRAISVPRGVLEEIGRRLRGAER